VATTAEASELRRYVALFFADLCDYTALNESCDPEIVVDLRRDVEAVASQVIRGHGGLITQVYGDGILAVFGLPSPRANDGRRAIEAALELHDAVRRLPRHRDMPPRFVLRLHTGVHGGLVFARGGDAVHGRYDLTGDPVNTAARLCNEAGPDEILVSSAIFSGVEGFFVTELRALDLQLKGKRASLSAHRVLGRSDVRTEYEARSRRGLTAFVGRAPEMATLEEVLRQAERSGGKVVVVCGPAGIGKSRLAEQLRQRVQARGGRTLLGWCESYAGMSPFEPFLQVLRQVFPLPPDVGREDGATILKSELDALSLPLESLPALEDLLFPAESTSTTALPGREPLLVEKTVVAVIRALGAQGPVLLALDDWQWADDGSRQVLDRVRRNIADRPICILLNMRTPDAEPQLVHDEVIALAPFSEQESAEVVDGLRRQTLDPSIAHALHRRSGGNPLFLEELCRSLPVGGAGAERSLEEATLPSTVQGVIQARIAGLQPEQVQLLQAASVIGIEFSLRLLGAACEDIDLHAALGALSSTDVVYRAEPQGTYRFKHGISREVIYESVRIGERRRIHTVVAEVIEGESAPAQLADHAEALAYHHRCAGNHKQAARFAELAGDKAMRASALDRARYQYGAALTELATLPETDDLKRRWLLITSSWAVACAYDCARSQLDHLRRAASFAVDLGDVGAQSATQNSLGWIHYALGDFADAEEHYRSALGLAEAVRNTKLVEQVWGNLGQTYAAAGTYDEALRELTRSIDAKRRRGGTGRGRVAQGFVYAMASRATVLADRGDFEGADRDMAEALDLLKNADHPVEGSVVAHQVIIEMRRGAWQAAAAAGARSRAICERLNSPFVFALSSAYEALATWMDRRDDGALGRAEHAIDWLERREHGLYLTFGYACLIEALVLAGDADRAREYAQRALGRAARGDHLGETAAHRALATWAAATGLRGDARSHLATAMRWGIERGASRDVAVTRLAAAELGEPLTAPTAEEEGRLALADFERWGMEWHATRARRLLRGPSGTP
jgi:class 3 adenylate cyclase/tetratricopeptide (TPR) repeat protein